MQITSQFKSLGVIGHPVSHSLSPLMMNAALQSLSLPYLYMAYDISPDQLQKAVIGMKALQFHGWNVTIPYKVAIMEYLDGVDESAQAIGAVNTVVYEDGKYMGYNTDGRGYSRSLLDEVPMNLMEQRVVILGAGGAARAVAYQLHNLGVSHLVIANRTVEKAKNLASQVGESVIPMVLEEAQSAIAEATLLINTTSVGMHPHVNHTPIPADWLHSEMVVSDLIYRPMQTRLLQEAAERGATIHNGLGMLIHQAAIAFEHWFGKRAPLKQMEKALQEIGLL